MAKSIFGHLEELPSRNGLKVTRDLGRHEEWTQAILPADAEASSPEGETSRRPLIFFAGVVAVVLLMLLGRLFALQVLGGNHNLALANGNRIRQQVERAPRGIIYDRNKVVLTQNVASYDVVVTPQLLPLGKAVRSAEYAQVASYVGLSAAEVQAKSEASCHGQNPATGCLASPVAVLVASGIPRDQALLVDQDANSLPGFTLDVNPIRQYSDSGLLSAFLGYTSRLNAQEAAAHPDYGLNDLIGKSGLEEQYEAVLRGANGGVETEVDALGKPIKVLANQDPVPGNNLVLTIDSGLDQHLAAAIQKQMAASGAIRAAGVALNPKTGEVLAAVSLPSYDDNLFSKGISQADYSSLLHNPGQPLFNKVTQGNYPSGSIIKPIGASAALQEGIINTSTTIVDDGTLVVPNPYDPAHPSIYYGWEHLDNQAGLGVMNVISALARSSDIFFYEVMGGFTNFVHYLGVTKLTDYYKLFGLGSKTGIDLPSETTGRVPTPAWKQAYSGLPWYTGDTYNIAVGQGDLLVDPLQMAVALSAIANGGTVYRPRLVDQVTSITGQVIQSLAPKVARQLPVSQQNLAIVRQGMLAAVMNPGGTACCLIKAQVPVQVAAKTGTAETVVHDDGTPAALSSKPDSWFEAFAPYDNPQIVIVVLLEHAGEGAVYAAPAVRETLTWYFTQGAGAQH